MPLRQMIALRKGGEFCHLFRTQMPSSLCCFCTYSSVSNSSAQEETHAADRLSDARCLGSTFHWKDEEVSPASGEPGAAPTGGDWDSAWVSLSAPFMKEGAKARAANRRASCAGPVPYHYCGNDKRNSQSHTGQKLGGHHRREAPRHRTRSQRPHRGHRTDVLFQAEASKFQGHSHQQDAQKLGREHLGGSLG